MSRGDHEAAEKYFNQALDFAQKDKMHRAEARARLALGSLNVQRDNPDRAIEYCRPALAFYEPGGYKKETCIALSLLGRADRQKGDYEGALKSFEQQLQVANDLRDQALKATALNDMGVLLSEQERYPEALARLDESYKINDSLGLTYNAGYDLMIRGGLLWQMGRYGEAESALDRALAIASEPKAGYQHLKAWVTVSRGQMALSRRRFQEAAEKAQQATVAGSSYPDIAIQAGCVLGLAKALSGAPEPGRQICEKAVLLARDRNNARELSTARLALAEVMLNSNDPQNALTAALQAEAVFAQSRWLESQWQALLIAARACKLMGRSEEKASYASRASSTLALLLQEWGIETSDGYTRRPDIEFRRRQLNGITGQAK
jgi:tetratricopeptide (TPR) repeat protein